MANNAEDGIFLQNVNQKHIRQSQSAAIDCSLKIDPVALDELQQILVGNINNISGDHATYTIVRTGKEEVASLIKAVDKATTGHSVAF
jgi:hypothetical protein